MAIVSCPSCHGKISSKAKQCTHCQFDLINQSTEQADKLRKEAEWKKQNSLQMQSFASVVLFALGVMIYYFATQNGEDFWLNIGRFFLGGGMIWYLVIRIWLLVNKYKK